MGISYAKVGNHTIQKIVIITVSENKLCQETIMKKFLIALLLATAVSFANAKTGHGSVGHSGSVKATGQDVVYATHSTTKLGLELPIGPVGSVHKQ